MFWSFYFLEGVFFFFLDCWVLDLSLPSFIDVIHSLHLYSHHTYPLTFSFYLSFPISSSPYFFLLSLTLLLSYYRSRLDCAQVQMENGVTETGETDHLLTTSRDTRLARRTRLEFHSFLYSLYTLYKADFSSFSLSIRKVLCAYMYVSVCVCVCLPCRVLLQGLLDTSAPARAAATAHAASSTCRIFWCALRVSSFIPSFFFFFSPALNLRRISAPFSFHLAPGSFLLSCSLPILSLFLLIPSGFFCHPSIPYLPAMDTYGYLWIPVHLPDMHG